MSRPITATRLTLALLACTIIPLALPSSLRAQSDSDTPLGDIARKLRKKVAAAEAVIDNDNLSKAMDNAETRRAAGSSPVFALDPGKTNFRVSSPDVSCNLTFNGKSASPDADPLLLDDLPRSELAKLDGPGTIDGDSLQISMHNGTSWEVREVVIGLTIVRRSEPGDRASYYGQARIVPAVAVGSSQAQDSSQKRPDVTVLLRGKGSAAPSSTATFRTPLNFVLFPEQEWHWAIVRAKGIPPQTPPGATTPQP